MLDNPALMKISVVDDRLSYKENIEYLFKVLNGLKNGMDMISEN